MAHVEDFHPWTTALNVKLLLPPRQSRGASLGMLVGRFHGSNHMPTKIGSLIPILHQSELTI